MTGLVFAWTGFLFEEKQSRRGKAKKELMRRCQPDNAAANDRNCFLPAHGDIGQLWLLSTHLSNACHRLLPRLRN